MDHPYAMDRDSRLITWREALAAFGECGLRDRVAGGALIRLYRGVYADAEVEIDNRLRIEAALVSAGPGLVAIRESAAALYGFDVLDSTTVHLAGGPAETARSQPGLEIHGIKLSLAERTRVGDLPATTAERSVVDLVRIASRIDALAVVDAALHVNACTAQTLATQLEAQRGQRGIVRAREIIRLGNGLAESPMESRLRMRILDAALPAPTLQFRLVDESGADLYRLDLAWPHRRVAVEYDGAGHMDRRQQRHDIARRTWLAHAGWTVLWATDADVYLDHRRFVRQLDAVLSRAAA